MTLSYLVPDGKCAMLSSKKNVTLLLSYDYKTSFGTKILDPLSVGCLGIAVNKSSPRELVPSTKHEAVLFM